MSLMMLRSAIVLACLACVGHGSPAGAFNTAGAGQRFLVGKVSARPSFLSEQNRLVQRRQAAPIMQQPHELTRRGLLGTVAAVMPFMFLGSATAAGEITYEVLTPPTDPSSPTPQRGQKVSVDYTLWIDGFEKKQIDTSKGSAFPPRLPSPFSFNVGVGEVISGWDRTVKQMRAGETRRVVVPASLAYGDKGAGPIPGGAQLYFEMQLLELKPYTPNEKQIKWLEEHPEP